MLHNGGSGALRVKPEYKEILKATECHSLLFPFLFTFYTEALIMKSIVAAIAALAFTVVSAQGQAGIVSVTSPTSGTVFTAGEDARISW